ncbi:MAG: hypothetical protein KF812_06725 [Fimbriimonadaceae bacterium]|nr:hypothetical protein [Fimbriimonadaceae bacterium]
MNSKACVAVLALFVFGCGGAGVGLESFDRTVVGVWEPYFGQTLLPEEPRTLTLNSDGTYRYQFRTVDQTRSYTYDEPVLHLEDNVIVSPDTFIVSFPGPDRMVWTIEYTDGTSSMEWRRTGAAPQ